MSALVRAASVALVTHPAGGTADGPSDGPGGASLAYHIARRRARRDRYDWDDEQSKLSFFLDLDVRTVHRGGVCAA
jgi:hypothetical protein